MLLYRQFLMEWKLYSRDRVAMFWTFLFPVLMLLGFGVMFRDGDGPKLSIVWVKPPVASAQDQALIGTLEQFHIKVQVLAPAEAEERWAKGNTAVQLESLQGSYRLRVNSYLAAQGQLTAQVVQQAFLVTQARLQGQPEPQFIKVSMESPGHAKATNYAAFLLPGLLGMNLLSMGLFSVGMVNVSYREKGKFRRLAVTPLPKWVFLMGQVLHRLTVTLIQTVVILAAGKLCFGIGNQGSYLLLASVMALGAACFMALGFALSSFAETSEAYAALSNVFFFPMLVLSGVYFTLESAPQWLQVLALGLPLSPFLKVLRAIFNDGAGLAGHGLGLAILGAWATGAFLLAVKKFRWA
jgi:ABC-type multidrug transport system permease subunit